MKVEWIMHSSHHFTGEFEGYRIDVHPPKWFIFKDGNMLDCYAYHSPTSNGELAARVQAERCLKVIIDKTK